MQNVARSEANLIAGIGIADGSSPMSFRYVEDTKDNILILADNVPTDAFEKKANLRSVPFHELRRLSQLAAPSIGLSGPHTEKFRSLADYASVYQQYNGHLMVEPWRLQVARDRVPVQRETWTCGANSGARFAAMLGSPIVHYYAYMDGMPSYGGGLFPRLGGNPEKLRDHLNNASELFGTETRQICNVKFGPIWQGFIDSLELHRPALALLMNSETSMHWVTIVGYVNDKFWYMNTDDAIYEIPGEDLHRWMNMGNCWAQKLNFVERYNSVVATGRHTPREK